MSSGPRRGRTEFPEVAIRTDAEGRYCLNDLHKAAGDLPKDQPAKYFANQQAKDLISEIGDHSVHVVRGYGKEQGTYVCKELVYAYAMQSAGWTMAKK